jgi:hypothetical protein
MQLGMNDWFFVGENLRKLFHLSIYEEVNFGFSTASVIKARITKNPKMKLRQH